jgi:murein DD-endopeptidase MepM/ murein hydrolase activator NlpD
MLFGTLQNAWASYTLRQFPLTGDQQTQVVSALSTGFSVNLADFSPQIPHLSPILTPAQLQKQGPDKTVAAPRTHEVKDGETLTGISAEYGLQIGSIVLANPQLKDTSVINTGDQLSIPDADAPANALASEARLRQNRNAGTAYADTKTAALPPIVQQVSYSNSLGTEIMWPAVGVVTQGYSWSHSGIDIANSSGTPIYAAADGEVTATEIGWNGGYGNNVMILHPQLGMSTHYAHLSYFIVRSGAIVKRGQVIGYMGSTGRSTGPHLHFETKTSVMQNPYKYLPGKQ